LRAVLAGVIENSVLGVGFDEPGGLRRTVAVDDRAGAGFLGVEGFLVASCSFGRVCSDRPPRPGVIVGIPHRLGPMGEVVDDAVGVPW